MRFSLKLIRFLDFIGLYLLKSRLKWCTLQIFYFHHNSKGYIWISTHTWSKQYIHSKSKIMCFASRSHWHEIMNKWKFGLLWTLKFVGHGIMSGSVMILTPLFWKQDVLLFHFSEGIIVLIFRHLMTKKLSIS